MSGILIHDGRRIGHRKWCIDAIRTGSADGVVITPFATPRVAEPRHPSASDLAQVVRDGNGEVVFDATTHALFLPATNKRDFYDTWELWGPAGLVLDDQVQLDRAMFLQLALYLVMSGHQTGVLWNTRTDERWAVQVPDRERFMHAVILCVTKQHYRAFQATPQQPEQGGRLRKIASGLFGRTRRTAPRLKHSGQRD